jgi:hypothetical protein
MEPIPLTIVGAGSLRCCPAVIGSLASYYGERPLEVRLYDADEERLDLFDRLARVAFEDTSVEHAVRAFADAAEALEGARLVVLQLDVNCARKYLRGAGEPAPVDDTEAKRVAVESLMRLMPPDALLLSLLSREIPVAQDMYYRIDWPPPVDDDAKRAVPFQVLRWLRREDWIYELVDANERSPFKRWLDDPTSAEPVLGTTG